MFSNCMLICVIYYNNMLFIYSVMCKYIAYILSLITIFLMLQNNILNYEIYYVGTFCLNFKMCMLCHFFFICVQNVGFSDIFNIMTYVMIANWIKFLVHLAGLFVKFPPFLYINLKKNRKFDFYFSLKIKNNCNNLKFPLNTEISNYEM